MNLFSFFQISYIFTTIAIISQRTHFLMSLLCLEGIILSLVLLIPSTLFIINITNISTLALVILTLGACEARLGLRIIVIMSRGTGSDILSALTSNKC